MGKKLECFAKPKYKIIESKSLDILYFSVEKFKSSFEQTRLYFENNLKQAEKKFDIYDMYRKTDNLLQTNLKKIIEETKIIKAINLKLFLFQDLNHIIIIPRPTIKIYQKILFIVLAL